MKDPRVVFDAFVRIEIPITAKMDGVTRQVGTSLRTGEVVVSLSPEFVEGLARKALRNRTGKARQGGLQAKVIRKTIVDQSL